MCEKFFGIVWKTFPEGPVHVTIRYSEYYLYGDKGYKPGSPSGPASGITRGFWVKVTFVEAEHPDTCITCFIRYTYLPYSNLPEQIPISVDRQTGRLKRQAYKQAGRRAGMVWDGMDLCGLHLSSTPHPL